MTDFYIWNDDLNVRVQSLMLMPTLIAVGSGVSWKAVALSCHMVAAVRLAAGRTWHAALVAIHTGSAFWETRDKEWVKEGAGAQQQIQDVSDLISSDLSCLSTLTVLTGDSPVAWTTHTRSSFPQARVAVGAMFETGLVTVSAPQALRTRLVTTRTLRGNKGERMNKKWRSGSAHILYQYHNGATLHLHQRKGPAFIEANNINSKMYSTIQVIIVSNGFL